jgi:uncharacterized protein (DUF305 family)
MPGGPIGPLRNFRHMIRGVARAAGVLTILALASACGRASPSPPPAPAVVEAAPPDVAFMQGMIGHHAQALFMTRLVPSRSHAADVRTLAERIAVSQREEIALMRRWLAARAHQVPDTTHLAQGHDMPGHRMPGMLTGDELRELAAARGDAFDRLFLELMIRHHEGALTMVSQLLRSPGGGQDPEAWRFAADVDADQRAEIARMRRMLAARGSPGGTR